MIRKTSISIGVLLMMLMATACGTVKPAEEQTTPKTAPAVTMEETQADPPSPETIAETDTLSDYSGLLDWYYHQISSEWSDYDTENIVYGVAVPDSQESASDTVSYLWYAFDKPDLTQAGYQLIDINHDGVDELIVGTEFEGVGTLNDLYTIYDGKIIRLASSGERDFFSVGDGVIAESGSGGAALHVDINYHLTDGKLVPFEEFKYDGDADPDEPLFYSDEPIQAEWGGYEFQNYQHIPEEEYHKFGGYEMYELNLQLFSDYTPTQE